MTMVRGLPKFARDVLGEIRDKLRTLADKAGTATPVETPKDAWKEAIVEACAVNHISWDENDARKSLRNLISWETQVALDPKVSEAAQNLINQGKATPVETASHDAEKRLQKAVGFSMSEGGLVAGRSAPYPAEAKLLWKHAISLESQLTQVREELRQMTSAYMSCADEREFWRRQSATFEIELGKAEAENKLLRGLLEEVPHDHTRSWDVKANKYVCETDCRGCEILRALHSSTPKEQ
jgi:hypothetical protein